ncbi:MAG TPA: glycine oxidase ThiO [Thermoanaerobaculia bacterium]|nr:glycine oxidase ThiO [Thermoanaerobaculia bacterium]
MKTSADVAIVGGGVIGLALARELSSRGVDVLVVERGRTGEEASSAAAGLLSAQSDAVGPSAFVDLALESRDLYSDWTDALEQETGLDAGWRRTGVLRCGGEQSLARFDWQVEAGLPVERLDARGVASLSRGRAAPGIDQGFFFPADAVVHSRRLVGALRRSLEIRGVAVEEGVSATRFSIEGGVCRGLETSAGSVACGRVVDAAGAWADLDPTLSFAIPVEPVRGQIVELADRAALFTVLESDEVYLVPRSDGSLLVGATVERTGFVKEVTAAGVAGLLAAAFDLVPSLRDARVVGAWAGLRPATPDGLPLLGESPVRSLILAAGHFRNGILLAPLTALLVADVVTGAGSRDLSAFSPARFAPDARALSAREVSR